MSIDAMKQALEALEGFIPYLPLPDKAQCGRYDKAITALRAAIEQAEVRTIKTWRQRCEEHPDHNGIVSEGMIRARMQEEIDELRAALKPRQWQGLTDKEIHECWPGINVMNVSGHFYSNIEAKLKEKNT